MANIKSAKRRILANKTKVAKSKAIRSKAKTAVRKVNAAAVAGDEAAAQTQLVSVIAEVGKAATKGVCHKNTASRKVPHLTEAVNAMA